MIQHTNHSLAPFSLVGGKTALLPYILERMPDDADRYVEDRERAVLFARRPVPFEIYNDYNGHLANLMWQIKNNQEYFLNLVLHPYDNTGNPEIASGFGWIGCSSAPAMSM